MKSHCTSLAPARASALGISFGAMKLIYAGTSPLWLQQLPTP
jgi:hypothetical protein